MLFDKKANDQAYNFWAKKTRARISDPKKREILAPLEAPHAWGTKRPSLEQDYYEQLDKPQNDIVNVKENPIVEVRENGIVTADGQLREFDIIALATGFDSVTGGMKNMGLRDIHGTLLKDKWAEGTYSYLGMVSHDFKTLLRAVNGRVKLITFASRLATISRTCSSSTEHKAQRPSPTGHPAWRSKATGSSTPSPR